GGTAVHGVIAVDPVGLAALLKLTHPIEVAAWPEAITAENVVDVTLKDAYSRFPISDDSERVAFLGDVARGVIEAFTTTPLGNVPTILDALGKATAGNHLMVYMVDPREERLMRSLGADGRVPELRGDSVLLVNQNMAANKLDVYLDRTLTYNVQLKPRGDRVHVTGSAEVALTNTATLDLPVAVIGPYLPDKFQAGENRTHVSLYSPFVTGEVLLDGEPTEATTHLDLSRRTQSATVSVGAGETRTLRFGIEGTVDVAAGGWYRLDLPRQPTLNPDQVNLNLALPEGWRIVETRGIPQNGERSVSAQFEQSAGQTIWLRLEPTGWTRVWDGLFG
ncbi:MAG: DUF4012 domain-containing protein, partial [Actinomycetota bacterium]|nr:DUF4012 domain-containing protein [Actinomycetota bacterium]